MTPNSQQLQVVEHFDGPCMVMAVPGSGKTASVTERTKRLITRGVDPKTILSITFTNKAANEMRERIGKAVGVESSSKMTISTFHSLCSRIIRTNCNHLGLAKNYSIYDSDDQERLLKTCIRKIEEAGSTNKFKPTKRYMNSLMGYIEGKRNAMLSDEVALEKYGMDGNQANVAAEYFIQLQRSNAVDFTGLLSETIRLFKEHPEIRDVYRSRFRYISVDEVQDTNIAQYQLIKDLGGHGNVLIVGDLDQSIYKFRSANPENILSFEKDFPGCKILMLEKNYRSTPSILKYSQKLIEHNLLRKGTSLTTDNPDGSAPQIRAGVTDIEMARMIAEDVVKKIASGIKPKEVAILYRTNYASRVLENAMRDHTIKYKIIGGLSFWDRKEVKAGISILKLLCNENDRMAFEKVVESCCKGVGDKAIATVADLAHSKSITFMDAAREFSTGTGAAPRCMKPLVDVMAGVSVLAPGDALLKIAHETSFWDRLEADSTDTNDRCGNILEMARDVGDYCGKPKCSLAGYLQNLSLITSGDEDADEEKIVKLMTLHGCKGLEFDVVYVSHCQADMLPHARLAEEYEDDEEGFQQALEEERRLLYVGMTRAKKHLTLFFAASKIDARSKSPKPALPSPFLFETGIVSADLQKYRFGDVRHDK